MTTSALNYVGKPLVKGYDAHVAPEMGWTVTFDDIYMHRYYLDMF